MPLDQEPVDEMEKVSEIKLVCQPTNLLSHHLNQESVGKYWQ